MARSVSALLFLVLLVGVTVASQLPQDYWKSMLPNTPMPGAVRDVLDVEGGVTVDLGDKGGAGAGVTDQQPVVVTVPGNPFVYRYAATDSQLHANPDVAVFFLQSHLHPGAHMKLHFTRTVPGAPFVPRATFDVIPFSSKKLPEILTRFSLQPSSLQAEAVKKTLQACEDPAAPGETRRCATSLESMVDFATSALGTRDVRVVSTEAGGERDGAAAPAKKRYTVAEGGVRKLVAGGRSIVACHAKAYPYAVFYCHKTSATEAYTVGLVGEDGGKVAAVAVCHTNTSAWNPGHLAFRLLKVKPGTVPICHFLPQDHIVWTPRQEMKS